MILKFARRQCHRLARYCANESEKMAKLKEKLREQERILIEKELNKQSPDFSMASNTVAAAGRGRILNFILLGVGGVFVYWMSSTVEWTKNPITEKKEYFIRRQVALLKDDLKRSTGKHLQHLLT